MINNKNLTILVLTLIATAYLDSIYRHKAMPVSNRAIKESEITPTKNQFKTNSAPSKIESRYKAGIKRSRFEAEIFDVQVSPPMEEDLPEEIPEKKYESLLIANPTFELIRQILPATKFEPEKTNNGSPSVFVPLKKNEQEKADKKIKQENVVHSIPTYNPSATEPTEEVNTCSANITGGSFSNPIGITLSCANASTIKYCLGIDTGSGCCDPEISGSDYQSRIIVGSKNGNYCLSYYGDSETAGTSEIYQHIYTINRTLPNLNISHPQIYYQTTQLDGTSFVNSTDFGKTGFNIGQINLKNHDPSPTAENLNCDQIIENYISTPTPNFLDILSSIDVSSDNPNLMITIPLRPDHLEYGDNFITTYIANNNFVSPIYACSTTKVVLQDFDFFESDLTFGETGNNIVREFTGGFSTYGFFEEETNIFRGPAGENTEDKQGQKLQSGFFGIFY